MFEIKKGVGIEKMKCGSLKFPDGTILPWYKIPYFMSWILPPGAVIINGLVETNDQR